VITQYTPIKPARSLPTEDTLKTLIERGMSEAAQQLLDINPELKFKIENGVLVDMVTGAALYLKKFITEDDETKILKSDAMKLAKVDDEVLILGETGTGKELIAKSMIGDRAGKFIAVNCAGLPETLIESELFGHKAGAFTGAIGSKEGMLKAATNGVIFLDEIGELPMIVQGKMLRALQEKKIRRVGDNEEQDINCRFVCATHRDLEQMVKDNLFRKDLYARISTFTLRIKPLRQRMGDIPPILKAIGEVLKIDNRKIQEFLQKYQEDYLNDKYDLSLNVRSLEQALKRFNVLGKI
jgi:transcriptional regulator with PAS, ATPase and Fis domain